MRNFGEYPFRNCLENRYRFQIGVSKAAKRGRKAPISRFLAPKKHARETFGYFPNSLSTHSGE